MTREEAAEILKHEKDYDAFVSDYRNKVHEALEMAIDALGKDGIWEEIACPITENTGVLNYVCNKCGEIFDFNTNYCPNCGCKMEVEA